MNLKAFNICLCIGFSISYLCPFWIRDKVIDGHVIHDSGDWAAPRSYFEAAHVDVIRTTMTAIGLSACIYLYLSFIAWLPSRYFIKWLVAIPLGLIGGILLLATAGIIR